MLPWGTKLCKLCGTSVDTPRQVLFTQECLAETEQWLADGGGDFDEKAYLMQTSMIAMASKMSKLISSVDSLQLLQRGIAGSLCCVKRLA